MRRTEPATARGLIPVLLLLGACQSDTNLSARRNTPPGPAPESDTPNWPGALRDVDFCGPTEPWCPGDEIPGWPSLTPDLAVLNGKEVVETEYRASLAWIDTASACPDDMPDCDTKYMIGRVQVLFEGGCVGYDCLSDGVGEGWYVQLYPSDVEAPRFQGLGWYDSVSCGTLPAQTPWVYSSFSPTLEGLTLMSPCAPEFDVPFPDRAFLSEVRPDRIRGLVYYDVTGDPAPGYPYNPIEYPVVYLLNFEVNFPPHGGFMGTGEVLPFPVETFRYLYAATQDAYDSAWPWDTITDPTIRDYVHELYKPYGMDW